MNYWLKKCGTYSVGSAEQQEHIHDRFAGDIALARCSQYGASPGQNSGKVLWLHIFIVALNEDLVAVVHSKCFVYTRRIIYRVKGGVSDSTIYVSF